MHFIVALLRFVMHQKISCNDVSDGSLLYDVLRLLMLCAAVVLCSSTALDGFVNKLAFLRPYHFKGNRSLWKNIDGSVKTLWLIHMNAAISSQTETWLSIRKDVLKDTNLVHVFGPFSILMPSSPVPCLGPAKNSFLGRPNVRSTLVVVLTLFIPLWALAKSVLFI